MEDPARSLASTKKMVPLGRLHIREAQHCISQHWDFNVLTSNLLIPHSPTVEEDFQWWKSVQCSEGSPNYPDRTRHSVVHGCIEHRLGNTLECIDGVRCTDNNRENTSHQRTRVRSHTQSHAPLAAEAYGSDSPGCVRQLHCSVLHQQAGLNKVNTDTVQTDQEATPHVSGQPNSTPGTTHPREIESLQTFCHALPRCQVQYGLYIHLSFERENGESHYWISLQRGRITNYLCPLFQIHHP